MAEASKQPQQQAAKSSTAGRERAGAPDDAAASLSLDELTRAFAAMFEQPDEPADDAASIPAESGELGAAAGEPTTATSIEIHPRTVLEAMLFVGRPDGRAVPAQEIAGFLRGLRSSEIDQLVRELNAEYQGNACPYTIVSDGPGYRLALRSEFEPLRERCLGRLRAARLSPAAMEVLALVAYNEPLTAEEISRLRGTPSGHILSHLVRRQLLRVERPSTKPAKPKYFTTARFLKVFGLRSRDDLPRSEDLDRQ